MNKNDAPGHDNDLKLENQAADTYALLMDSDIAIYQYKKQRFGKINVNVKFKKLKLNFPTFFVFGIFRRNFDQNKLESCHRYISF